MEACRPSSNRTIADNLLVGPEGATGSDHEFDLQNGTDRSVLKDHQHGRHISMAHPGVAPPTGARVVAGSPSAPIAAFEDPERRLYGVQFHPEVVHTPYGMEVLKNFLYRIADAPPTWTAAAVIEEETARVRARVGRERILCALSGGVDDGQPEGRDADYWERPKPKRCSSGRKEISPPEGRPWTKSVDKRLRRFCWRCLRVPVTAELKKV